MGATDCVKDMRRMWRKVPPNAQLVVVAWIGIRVYIFTRYIAHLLHTGHRRPLAERGNSTKRRLEKGQTQRQIGSQKSSLSLIWRGVDADPRRAQGAVKSLSLSRSGTGGF